MPGPALLVVSRGIIEADYGDADHQLRNSDWTGWIQAFSMRTALSASELCTTI
jgi:hypothetical protein